jgi:membrane protease YdiL (CAAX protease family)
LLFPARVSYTRLIVDTPTDTPAAETFANANVAEFAPVSATQAELAARSYGPDDPPWGVGAALLVWIASVMLLLLVPTLAGVAYIIAHLRAAPAGNLGETLLKDPTFILISVAAIIPAHLLTLWLVWWLVTANGRRSFRDVLGLHWSRRLGRLEVVAWLGVVGLLFVCNGVIARYFKGGDTDLEKIIASSVAARYVVVLLATFTAPAVEETVYRGVLYPALRRWLGTFVAFLIVAAMFAGVHVYQYRENLGVVLAISLLSITLTLVRAQTRRLLPCIIIHTLFNGVTSIAIVAEQYLKHTPPDAQTQGLLIQTIARGAGLSL